MWINKCRIQIHYNIWRGEYQSMIRINQMKEIRWCSCNFILMKMKTIYLKSTFQKIHHKYWKMWLMNKWCKSKMCNRMATTPANCRRRGNRVWTRYRINLWRRWNRCRSISRNRRTRNYSKEIINIKSSKYRPWWTSRGCDRHEIPRLMKTNYWTHHPLSILRPTRRFQNQCIITFHTRRGWFLKMRRSWRVQNSSNSNIITKGYQLRILKSNRTSEMAQASSHLSWWSRLDDRCFSWRRISWSEIISWSWTNQNPRMNKEIRKLHKICPRRSIVNSSPRARHSWFWRWMKIMRVQSYQTPRTPWSIKIKIRSKNLLIEDHFIRNSTVEARIGSAIPTRLFSRLMISS